MRANISGLFFTPSCPEDTGNYTVMAVNDYGLESASAFVHVVCEYTTECYLLLKIIPIAVQLCAKFYFQNSILF